MPANIRERMARAQGTGQGSRLCVLDGCAGQGIGAFEFDAHRKIIAACAPPE